MEKDLGYLYILKDAPIIVLDVLILILGILTKEKASEYLQELFLLIQGTTPISSDRFYRGGESHFCVGGFFYILGKFSEPPSI